MKKSDYREKIDLLIIENDPGDYRRIRDFLDQHSSFYGNIRHADNLNRAIDQIQENLPQIILLDLNLPESNGLETYINLKEQTADIPVVILSNPGEEESGLQAVRMGAQVNVVKELMNADNLCKSILYSLERKKLQLNLKAEREYYRDFVESLDDWVWEIDLQGLHTYSNQAVRNILGYQAEEIIGKYMYQFWPPSHQTEERIRPALDSLQKELGWKNQIAYFWHKDGYPVCVESTALPIYNLKGSLQGYRGIDRDISERMRMEKELKKSEEKYRELLENINEVAYSVDEEGTITYVSPAIESLLGDKSVDMIGKSCLDFFYSEDQVKARENLAKALGGETIIHDLRLITRNNQIKWVRISSQPGYDGSKIRDIHGILVDITELKNSEFRVAAHKDQLKLINKILRHDLANNLAAIQSAIRLTPESSGNEYLQTAMRNVSNSLRLIHGMRSLEQLVEGTTELRQISLRNTINAVMNKYQSLEYEIKGNAMVMADEALSSVIDNLVRNAIWHGKSNKIRFEISRKDNTSQLKVIDFGQGIPEELKNRIFQENFHFGQSGNTGLGLFIVHKLMERYQGGISIEDTKPQGATFCLTFNQ
ncbi:MAG: PAS domain S-box protein [Candidatus Cloacimonetes bacterium]|nr:PAS domain S-box protein [Candidatus Cloacimonadota bacterium]